ncbi:MAG: hypothetical protein JWO31_3279 [Phycisphaerales bacterium]|nr:hypothetical protein [Phycisphaerales bacterium]
MANELIASDLTPGATYYAVATVGGLYLRADTAAVEAFSSAHWPSYAIAAGQANAAGDWFGTFPAGAPGGVYVVRLRRRVGSTPDLEDDAQEGSDELQWAGGADAESVPGTMPVSVAQLRAYLRISGTDEDALLADAIAAATEHVERETRQRLISRAATLKLDGFPAGPIALPWVPVLSVDGVTAGGETIDPDTYTVDVHTPGDEARGGRVLAVGGWPGSGPVVISYTAGYGDSTADVPPSLRRAVLWLAGHFFENREAATEKPLTETPLGVRTLIESNMFREAFSA